MKMVKEATIKEIKKEIEIKKRVWKKKHIRIFCEGKE